MIQYTTVFSYPAVTHLQRLSARHNIKLAELFQNLDTQFKHYAELVAKLESYFQEDRTPILALQANNIAVNSCSNIADTFTKQLPTVI